MVFGQHIQLEPPMETRQLLLQPVKKPQKQKTQNILQPNVYNASVSLDGTRRTIETQASFILDGWKSALLR